MTESPWTDWWESKKPVWCRLPQDTRATYPTRIGAVIRVSWILLHKEVPARLKHKTPTEALLKMPYIRKRGGE